MKLSVDALLVGKYVLRQRVFKLLLVNKSVWQCKNKVIFLLTSIHKLWIYPSISDARSVLHIKYGISVYEKITVRMDVEIT